MQVIEILGDAGTPENLTGSDTAQSITSTIIHPVSGIHKGMTAIGALVTCEDNTLNVTFDGTTPTASAGTNVGHALYDGDSHLIRGANNVRNFQLINRVSGSVGVAKVTPFF